ncbi:MAG TPA: hypothetical protein VJB05_03715 [archaeon]|nr:hypothetical protein [archaeon]
MRDKSREAIRQRLRERKKARKKAEREAKRQPTPPLTEKKKWRFIISLFGMLGG